MLKMNSNKIGLNPTTPCPHTRWPNWSRAAGLVLLGFVPYLSAQTNETMPGLAARTVGASSDIDKKVGLYTLELKEAGSVRTVHDLKVLWCRAFTNDSFVITEMAERVRLPGFEVRNVRLAELARSVEFLSQGALTVEVAEGNASGEGNTWRIGTRSAADTAAVKMRAVAAPHVFASAKSVENLLRSAASMDRHRIESLEVSLHRDGVGPSRDEIPADVMPLREQKVFVVIGREASVAGVESLIQATEQAAAAEAPKTTKSGQ